MMLITTDGSGMLIVPFASWVLRNARMTAEKTKVASFYNIIGNIDGVIGDLLPVLQRGTTLLSLRQRTNIHYR